MKDPAFLFYAKDFYEGTRMMLPEERACYIDLLIYQHQNGIIPLDLRRVLMYCSGVEQATLEATLEAKFKLTSEGWLNQKLSEVIKDREEFTKKQSESGKVGQFWKKIYQIFKKQEVLKLKKIVSKALIMNVYDLLDLTDINTLEGSLKRCLSNNANVNAIANEDENIIKEFLSLVTGGMGGKTADKSFSPPTIEEVAAHCLAKNSPVVPEQFVNFYRSKGWKVGDQPMKDWKAAIVTWEIKMREKGIGGNRIKAQSTGEPIASYGELELKMAQKAIENYETEEGQLF